MKYDLSVSAAACPQEYAKHLPLLWWFVGGERFCFDGGEKRWVNQNHTHTRWNGKRSLKKTERRDVGFKKRGEFVR